MKIRLVKHNNRKKAFEIRASGKALQFPYSKVNPRPRGGDPIERVFVDKEMGSESFTYVLESGKEGTVHIEQVLEYNQDPRLLRDALLYRLTIEAQNRLKRSALSKREIIRRLGTMQAVRLRARGQVMARGASPRIREHFPSRARDVSPPHSIFWVGKSQSPVR